MISMNQFILKVLSLFNITNHKWMNSILFYIVAVFLIFLAISLIKILIYFVTDIIEKLLRRATNKIFKSNIQIVEYSFKTVWIIKCNADINHFLNWLNSNVFKTYKVVSYGSSKISIAKTVRIYSLQNILETFNFIIKSFFSFSILHILAAILVVYIYYTKEVQILFSIIMSVLVPLRTISIQQILDVCELTVILFTAIFIISDIRHKVNGYSTLRAERFKELVSMEERLLSLMEKMSYGLGKNIDALIQKKHLILNQGASILLNGKECYIHEGHIKLCGDTFRGNFNRTLENIMSEFTDIDEAFSELNELNERFRKSSLNYRNIYLIDHQAILIKLLNFWNLGEQKDYSYKKMIFLCQNSRKEWFENWFIKPSNQKNTAHFERSIENVEKTIIDASYILDMELQEAFEYELILKRYIKKINKRIKKINSFSKYSFMK